MDVDIDPLDIDLEKDPLAAKVFKVSGTSSKPPVRLINLLCTFSCYFHFVLYWTVLMFSSKVLMYWCFFMWSIPQYEFDMKSAKSIV